MHERYDCRNLGDITLLARPYSGLSAVQAQEWRDVGGLNEVVVAQAREITKNHRAE